MSAGLKKNERVRRLLAILLSGLMLQATVSPSLAAGAVVLLDRTAATHATRQQQQQQQKESLLIGVLDLDPIGVQQDEARAISERLRLYVGRQDVFDVIERNRMEEIMEELGFQLSGACATDECVVQVGKILGARKMIAGSVSKVGNLYSLQIRIIDIETSRIEEQVFKDVTGIEDVLTLATADVAVQLANVVRGLKAPAPQQPVVQPPVQQPPVEQAPARRPEEEESVQQPKKKGGKTWLYLFMLAVVGGGGAALAMGGGGGADEGGVTGPAPIPLPPARPIPPR